MPFEFPYLSAILICSLSNDRRMSRLSFSLWTFATFWLLIARQMSGWWSTENQMLYRKQHLTRTSIEKKNTWPQGLLIQTKVPRKILFFHSWTVKSRTVCKTVSFHVTWDITFNPMECFNYYGLWLIFWFCLVLFFFPDHFPYLCGIKGIDNRIGFVLGNDLTDEFICENQWVTRLSFDTGSEHWKVSNVSRAHFPREMTIDCGVWERRRWGSSAY